MQNQTTLMDVWQPEREEKLKKKKLIDGRTDIDTELSYSEDEYVISVFK